MLKAVILGYGGIALSHRLGYERLAAEEAPVRLTALCDTDPARFAALDDDARARYRLYTDLEEMLAAEAPDIVDVCLPTPLHCPTVLSLLGRGYHVQCEKPMGRTAAECAQLLDAAKKGPGRLMIGMCLRFEPLYTELKRMVDSGCYGKVAWAHFDRLSGLPSPGWQDWYRDYARAGGVALDMHIHDVDMVQWLFGLPQAVRALTSDSKVRCTTIHSSFLYPDKLVTADGSWGQAAGSPFRMEYRVQFEKATVEMAGGRITVCPEAGEAFVLELAPQDRMACESRYFAACLLAGEETTRISLADAAADVALVEKLMQSAEAGGERVEV